MLSSIFKQGITIGLVAIASLFIFYLYSEQRRLDARIFVVTNQLSMSLLSIQNKVEKLQERVETFDFVPFPHSLIFGGGGSPPNDDFKDEDEEDEDEDEEDDERLRLVLVGGEDLDDDVIVLEGPPTVVIEEEVDDDVIVLEGPPTVVIEEEEGDDVIVSGGPSTVIQEEEVLPMDSLSSLKLPELRKRLADLGIDSKGTKEALLTRLRSHAIVS